MDTKDESSKASRRSPGELLALAIAVVSLVGVVLSLLGVGVVFSVQSVLGIPHATLLNSAFDALDLSTIAIMEGLSHPYFVFDKEIYVEIWRGSFPIIVVLVVVGWALLAIIVRVLRSRGPKLTSSHWLVQVLQTPRPRHDSIGLIVRRAIAHGILLFVSAPVGILTLLATVFVAASALSIVPILGFEAGRDYLQTYVIAAEHCIPVQDRQTRILSEQKDKLRRERGDERKSIPGATCVTIRQANSEVVSGRVAYSTSTAMVLYDPVSGIARRVPIGDAVVESLGALPAPASATDEPSK
jgi:hypothetical protein